MSQKEKNPKGDVESNSDDFPAFKINDRRIPEDSDIAGESEDAKSEDNKLPSYLIELNKRAEESEAKLKEYIAAYKEKLAENDAFKQRLENDFKSRGEKIKGDVVSSFLSFSDNLDRAVDAIPSDRDDSIAEGIRMVRTMFWERMIAHGVEHLDMVGEIFDPNISEAVMVEDVLDKEKDNLVTAELEKGYRIGDRLLRTAKVKVAVFKGE